MYKRNTPHTADSLLARTKKKGTCLVWQGATTSSGYGVTTYYGHQTTAHRIMATLVHGEIPRGHEVHHTCRNRACINPAHLEIVSHAENLAMDREARTTCRAGHPWDEDNTYLAVVTRKQGGTRTQRYCRKCRAEYQAQLRQLNPKRTT